MERLERVLYGSRLFALCAVYVYQERLESNTNRLDTILQHGVIMAAVILNTFGYYER